VYESKRSLTRWIAPRHPERPSPRGKRTRDSRPMAGRRLPSAKEVQSWR